MSSGVDPPDQEVAEDAEESASDPGSRARARELMERYATSGDEHAYNALYDIIAPRLWGYLCRRLPAECARDVMQQTFVRMHEARGRFRMGSDVFPWMYSIAYNLTIDCVRKTGRQIRLHLESERGSVRGEAAPAPDQQLEAKQRADKLSDAFEALPERQRGAYELVYFEDLSHDEAAEALGCTRSAIKSLVHRALESIRKACGDDGDGDS